MKRFFAWLFRDDGVHRVVKIKSWQPVMGPYGIEWPTLLVDRQRGCGRQTISPVWNAARVRQLFPSHPEAPNGK